MIAAAIRTDAVASAAARLTDGRDLVYQHEGRGPWVFDEIGFLRYCVGCSEALGPLADLADIKGYHAFPGLGPSAERRMALIEAWGMVRLKDVRDARPGDVLVYIGLDSCFGILLEGGAEVVAVMPPRPPARYPARPVNRRCAARAYGFREAGR